MRRAIRGLAVDVAPLRSSRDFRTLWLGQLIPQTGHQVYHPSLINQVMWNPTMIVGPALGGILIAHVGLAWAYAVDVITYAAAIVAVLMIRPMPPEGETRATGTAAIREGFRYLKGRRVLQSTFAI